MTKRHAWPMWAVLFSIASVALGILMLAGLYLSQRSGGSGAPAAAVPTATFQPVERRKEINDLVASGKLRPATEADIAAWVAKAVDRSKRLNEPPPRETIMRVGRTYVVLGEIELPDDMSGSNRRDFIVPDGVPMPAGPPGHNGYYRMDGTEEGPLSRARARTRPRPTTANE